MKIKLKHAETELIIEDEKFVAKDNRSLIYNNQSYILTLIEKMAEQIIRLQTNKLT